RTLPRHLDPALSAANAHLATFDNAGDTDAGTIAEALDGGKRTEFRAGGGGHCTRDRVLARILDRACQPQRVGACRTIQGHHFDELELAFRDRAGPVEP